MTSMTLHLRGGEKLYLNGAVIKVDRRVSIEILNDVTFLLQSHVLQPQDATSPLRQLYFAVQSALMDPAQIGVSLPVIRNMLDRTLATFSNRTVIHELNEVRGLIDRGRYFDALRIIRSLFQIEARILKGEVIDPRAA